MSLSCSVTEKPPAGLCRLNNGSTSAVEPHAAATFSNKDKTHQSPCHRDPTEGAKIINQHLLDLPAPNSKDITHKAFHRPCLRSAKQEFPNTPLFPLWWAKSDRRTSIQTNRTRATHLRSHDLPPPNHRSPVVCSGGSSGWRWPQWGTKSKLRKGSGPNRWGG